MATYSFSDTYASITGPGGTITMGSGAGAAEEGISVEWAGDRDTMTMGADGEGMHSLHPDKSGTITVRLLKTSPVNALLTTMFNTQTASSAAHGINTITIRNTNLNDNITARRTAFKKMPNINYAKEGGSVEWVFNSTKIDATLGAITAANI